MNWFVLGYCMMVSTLGYSSTHPEALRVLVDLTRDPDAFWVEVEVPASLAQKGVFHFAATAPGTYQFMNIGRFVTEFAAWDAKGRELEVAHPSVNQFAVREAKRLARLTYRISETWNTPVSDQLIYPMAGTTIESDHGLINGQAVFGYFAGAQDLPYLIQLRYPPTWTVGTALPMQGPGMYAAQSFDHLADSPILLGMLSQADKFVANCNIRVFVYSKSRQAQATGVLKVLEPVVSAMGRYLGKFPVDHYTFLYHFEEFSSGGWEHAYSSFYIASEHELAAVLSDFIPRTASHELFHMVTPLHISSDHVRPFDFQTPKPTAHVWFFEGVTEWASGMATFRSGQKSLESYLEVLRNKLLFDEGMDGSFSLERMGLESYTELGQTQWPNVYNRGALVAALLDLLILNRSEGKQGLRELILELVGVFGSQRTFKEDAFVDILKQHSHPDVQAFYQRYIQGVEPLPVTELFETIGIDYHAELAQGQQPELGFAFRINSERKVLMDRLSAHQETQGLRSMEEVLAIDNMPIRGDTLAKVEKYLAQLGPHAPFAITVRRNGKNVVLQTTVGANAPTRHHFRVNPNPSPRQALLRQRWSQPLPPLATPESFAPDRRPMGNPHAPR